MNGTPNLQDRFVVGAGSGYAVGNTGGNANATLVSHSHLASTDPQGSHFHSLYVNDRNSEKNENLVGNPSGVAGDKNGNKYFANNNSAGAQLISSVGNHTHNVTVDPAGSSGTNANLPPYYALAYIMRTS